MYNFLELFLEPLLEPVELVPGRWDCGWFGVLEFELMLISRERLGLPLSLPPLPRVVLVLDLGFWLLPPMLEPCLSSSSSLNGGFDKIYSSIPVSKSLGLEASTRVCCTALFVEIFPSAYILTTLPKNSKASVRV